MTHTLLILLQLNSLVMQIFGSARNRAKIYTVLSRFPHVKREHLHVHCNIKTM